ncbi:MAG: NAD(P)/FAD-dependent oxidoreductase [Nitrospinota bacterium]|nr:NAD(P)/FAD-dependent oxidoreductase [Nitrospinota bacterium]
MSANYVIIGCGAAGVAAAESIRERDENCKITMYNGEPFPFYFRPALSYFMKGLISEEKLYAKPVYWAQARGIRALHEKVASVRPVDREVAGDSGMVTSYDKLLIATGAWPVTLDCPGANLPGVFTYRSIMCCRKITGYIQKRAVTEAVVVGGGILGVELAENFMSLGLKVTMVVRGSRLLDSRFDAQMAQIIQRKMEADGATFVFGAQLAEVASESGHTSAVITDGGQRISAGIVGVAVGVRPMGKFLTGSGIDWENGIAVDSWQRTGVDGVFAAGDVAQVKGAHGSPGGWLTASLQGARAGYCMAGGEEDARPVTYLNASHVYKMRYALVGRFSAPEEGAIRKVRLTMSGEDEYGLLTLENGRIVGGAFLGGADLAWDVARAVENRVRVGQAQTTLDVGTLRHLANSGAPAALF